MLKKFGYHSIVHIYLAAFQSSPSLVQMVPSLLSLSHQVENQYVKRESVKLTSK